MLVAWALGVHIRRPYVMFYISRLYKWAKNTFFRQLQKINIKLELSVESAWKIKSTQKFKTKKFILQTDVDCHS